MIESAKMKMALLIFLLSVFAVSTYAQEPVTVRIGDRAPDFKYSKWLKGEPLQSFTGDKFYVLEFWATWCGPCKAAMPKLSKLQEKYSDNVSIIGVNVWEHVGEKPYETVLSAVEKYVKGNDTNMVYSVTIDNNDQHMGNKWLKASGNYGIPTTFVIKDEKILWIGHPEKLDSILQTMINGTFNMQEYKLAYEKRTESSAKQIGAIQGLMMPINDAIRVKEYAKALELIERARIEMPTMKMNLDMTKFSVLVKSDEQRAIQFAKEWVNDFKSAPLYIMSGVHQEDGLLKSTYLWAANNLVSSGLPMNAAALHALATTYAKGGDFKNAVINEENAVEQAKTALKEGKMIGTIMDYTVKEYEEALAAYKKGKMPKKATK